jgi:peptidoglycan/xylan/chitin deacetylase (PgdA/CDA1 family)
LVGISAGLAAALLLTGCSSSSSAAHQHRAAEAKPQASPSSAESPNPYSVQVPIFGPRPKPERVTLPPSGPLAPIFKTVPTTQPVVFITVDDGQVQLPEIFDLLKAAKVPISTFLISPVAAKNPQFFRTLRDDYGAPIEAHTLTHPKLKGMPYEKQRHEICGSADQLKQLFGKRPTLFRPPYGEYDQTTLRAAHDCGMHAVFYWRESVTRGHVYYQTSEKKLRPGDIILMHFRKEFVTDFIATLNEIKANGLTPALLENYIN